MTTPCPHCNDTRTVTLLYSQVPCECATWSQAHKLRDVDLSPSHAPTGPLPVHPHA